MNGIINKNIESILSSKYQPFVARGIDNCWTVCPGICEHQAWLRSLVSNKIDGPDLPSSIDHTAAYSRSSDGTLLYLHIIRM